jgi:hypothetical protein
MRPVDLAVSECEVVADFLSDEFFAVDGFAVALDLKVRT